MSVSPSFLSYVLELLGRVEPVTARKMFGAAGVYSRGLFFAIVDDDRVYFKVDDTTRGAYEARGCAPFQPMPDKGSMNYCEVPADVLEDEESLRPWMLQAIDVAQRANRK